MTNRTSFLLGHHITELKNVNVVIWHNGLCKTRYTNRSLAFSKNATNYHPVTLIILQHESSASRGYPYSPHEDALNRMYGLNPPHRHHYLIKLKDFWSATKKAGNTDCCTVLLVSPLICLWGSIDFQFVCWSCCCRYNIYQPFTWISLHEYSAFVLYNLFTNIGDKILKSIKKHIKQRKQNENWRDHVSINEIDNKIGVPCSVLLNFLPVIIRRSTKYPPGL